MNSAATAHVLLTERTSPMRGFADKDQNMPTHFHAVVWLDRSEAKVFHIGLTGADEVTLHPHLQTKHLHHKANSIGTGHAAPDKHFFQEIAGALNDAGEILIIGPAGA